MNNKYTDLEKLETKINKFKEKYKTKENHKNKNIKFFSLAMNILLELTAGIFVGGLIGFFLDKFFNTKFIFLLFFIVFGLISGIINLNKHLKTLTEKENN